MENMEQQVTIKDVIAFSVRDLNAINIPVELIPTAGIAISRVVANLNTCLRAIVASEEKRNQPEVNVEEVEELPDNVTPIPVNGGE